MTILYIAIGVCAVVFVAWVILMLIDGRRLRGMRGHYYPSPLKLDASWGKPVNAGDSDDDTKTWPTLPERKA